MSRLCVLVDVSALRGLDRGQLKLVLEACVKSWGPACTGSALLLLDLQCDGGLLNRQQHAGCHEKIEEEARIQQRAGNSFDPVEGLTGSLPTVYHLIHGAGLKILLAAQESIGAAKLGNLQQCRKLLTEQLQGVDGDAGSRCVTMLTKLPKTLESIQDFLQLPSGSEQLLDPEASEQACFEAIYQRCHQLLAHWIRQFKDNSVQFLLLLSGYTEHESSTEEALLAYSLHLLLLTEFPAGSSVCPLQLTQTVGGDTWEVDRNWHKTILKSVVKAAGQTGRLAELGAKAQALKLATEPEANEWLQQQYHLFRPQTNEELGPAHRPAKSSAAATQSARTTALGDHLAAAAAAAAATAAACTGEPCKLAAALEGTATVELGTGLPQPHSKAVPKKRLLKQQVQPGKTGPVGCQQGDAGPSRRTGALPVLGGAARRVVAASDLPQQCKAAAVLVAGRSSGLASDIRQGPVQLTAHRPNNIAAATGMGSSGLHTTQCQPSELIPPISFPAADDMTAEHKGDNNSCRKTLMTSSTAVGSQRQQPVTAEPVASQQQQQQQQQQMQQQQLQPALSKGNGCLAAANLQGNTVAEFTTAFVRQHVEQLLAGRRRTGALKTRHVVQLKKDLNSSCEAAVHALVQQYPDDQDQWSYGISAAAREVAVYSKQQLERLKDSCLKELAHQLDGMGSDIATRIAAAAELPAPDAAAIRRAHLRQGLLVITDRDHYLHPRVDNPGVVLQPAFRLLFCLHSILLVGPLVACQIARPDMAVDAVRWSAKTQYVTAVEHAHWFLHNMEMCWDLWARWIQKDHQQQQQQQQGAAACVEGQAPEASQPNQLGSQEGLLLFGAYADVHDWFNAVVLPDLQSQGWLAGLHEALKWTKGIIQAGLKVSEEVPTDVNFDSQHQLGDPALLGAALQWEKSQQKKPGIAEVLAKLKPTESEEAQYRFCPERVREGVGTTAGVPGDALVAAAAEVGGDTDAVEVNGCGGSATKPTKRRCFGPAVTSGPAAASRPSAPPVDPLQALKAMRGLPGKNQLRFQEPPKRQKKPRLAGVSKELEDDADSCQPRTAATAARGTFRRLSHHAVAVREPHSTAAAAASGDPGVPQRPLVHNKFARQKVIKQPVVKEPQQDQQQVEAELADFGINLGVEAPQRLATVTAPRPAAPAAAAAKPPNLLGLSVGISTAPRPVPHNQTARPVGFLAALAAPRKPQGTAAGCTPAAAAAATTAEGGGVGCNSRCRQPGSSSIPAFCPAPRPGKPPQEQPEQQQSDSFSSSLPCSEEQAQQAESFPDIIPGTPSKHQAGTVFDKPGPGDVVCQLHARLQKAAGDTDQAEPTPIAAAAQHAAQHEPPRQRRQQLVESSEYVQQQLPGVDTLPMTQNRQQSASGGRSGPAAVADGSGAGTSLARPLAVAPPPAGSGYGCKEAAAVSAAQVECGLNSGEAQAATAGGPARDSKQLTTVQDSQGGPDAWPPPPAAAGQSDLARIGTWGSNQPHGEAAQTTAGLASRGPDTRPALAFDFVSPVPAVPSQEVLQALCARAAANAALFRATIARAKNIPEQEDLQKLDPLTRNFAALHGQPTAAMFHKPCLSLEQIREVQKVEKAARQESRQRRRQEHAARKQARAAARAVTQQHPGAGTEEQTVAIGQQNARVSQGSQ